ncbi:hypothetical protein HYZ70_01070 [Candidatus Curtissbacteria bacterium]|nr:hypothetical protein [Candidatus Curtissbacteria bacterium]
MFKSARLFPLVTYGLFGFLFFHFAKEMLQVRDDGWYVGQVNLYGDLVLHISFINKFLETGKVIVDSPIYAGAKPNYPIFADFITAQIAKITTIDWALFITTFLGGLLVVYIARLFIKNFIRNEKVIFLTLLLFFINGGLGFLYFFQDYATTGGSFINFLTNLPNEYTDIKEKGYWWINTYLAYFLPQRGFLFAFPITLTSLALLYQGTRKAKSLYFLLAGLLSGVLPLVQAHSLFVIFLLSALYFPSLLVISKNKKELAINWIVFAAVTAALALPLFKTISSSDNALSFIRFDPGFTSEENIVWFWTKNLGLFAPVLIAAIIWIFKNHKHLFFLYLPFLMLFAASNIFIFQPWDFDNTKILIYWYFASSVLVAYFIYEEFLSQNVLKKAIGSTIVTVMILSGAIDIVRTFTPPTNYRIFAGKDLEVAQAVKNLTAKDSLFVTASNHNHPIPTLTGRSTLLGFHGWVWSHGLDYQERQEDIKKIYQGGKTSSQLIAKYRVSYVTIGPHERSEFAPNENYFGQFPQIYIARDWSLYDVGYLWSNSNR